jgi:thioredoxin 1
MRRFIIALALIPVASFIMMAFYNPSTATRVKFNTGDWDSAQKQAKSENKLYFVDFDASYCASCRNMDESTYQDGALASFIEQSVVALRLDVQDFDGVMWSQKYEVEALPTMLIFNEEGKLVKRLVGYKSARDLLAAFQEARVSNTNNSNNNATPQPVMEDKPLLKPALSTRPSSHTTVTPTPVPAPRPTAPITSSINKSTGKGLFEVTVRKVVTSSSYTVQLGVFSSYDILMEQADKMSQRFSSQKTMIHVDEMNGVQVFKLLLGTFPSKREADLFRAQLRKSGMDGLVKDLSIMQ